MIYVPTEEGEEYAEAELHVIVSHPMWVLGANSGSLEKQQTILTTQPSLLPPNFLN